MNSSNCFSINKASPFPFPFSFPNNASSSCHSNIKPPRSSINNNTQSPKQEFQEPKVKQKPIKRQKPTILEVEKAIDAGSFTDSDPNRKSEESVKSLQSMLKLPFEKNESFAEKQLRQTGEWVSQKAERRLRSASRPILMFLVQWMLPVWILALLIFSGVVKLPFHTHLLDDLLF